MRQKWPPFRAGDRAPDNPDALGPQRPGLRPRLGPGHRQVSALSLAARADCGREPLDTRKLQKLKLAKQLPVTGMGSELESGAELFMSAAGAVPGPGGWEESASETSRKAWGCRPPMKPCRSSQGTSDACPWPRVAGVTRGREGTGQAGERGSEGNLPRTHPPPHFVQRPSFFIQNAGRRRTQCHHLSAWPCGQHVSAAP